MKNINVLEHRVLEKAVNSLLKEPGNRTCMDCEEPRPQYVNLSHYTFVCTSCSSILCNFGFRVKNVTMSSFTLDEIKALRIAGGNTGAKSIYLGKLMPEQQMHNMRGNFVEMRKIIHQRYIELLWFVKPRRQSCPPVNSSTEQATIQLNAPPTTSSNRRRSTRRNSAMATVGSDSVSQLENAAVMPQIQTNNFPPIACNTSPMSMSSTISTGSPASTASSSVHSTSAFHQQVFPMHSGMSNFAGQSPQSVGNFAAQPNAPTNTQVPVPNYRVAVPQPEEDPFADIPVTILLKGRHPADPSYNMPMNATTRLMQQQQMMQQQQIMQQQQVAAMQYQQQQRAMMQQQMGIMQQQPNVRYFQ